MENLFFGNYSHALDEKNRLVIPRKMREQLGSKVFIMKGFDGALSIYHESAFSKLVEQLEKLQFNHKKERDYLRIQLASVVELEFDRLGRIIIPGQLLNKYHIGKDVLIVGVGDHIEIWNQTLYEEYAKSVEQSFEDIAEEIGKVE